MSSRLPDAVLPPQEMGTFFDPSLQVCGFTILDPDGRLILVPIPGEIMSALINDARRELDSIDGAMNWLSIPGAVAPSSSTAQT
ncbi:MAG: hypothetical protein JNM76_17735 [Betaproteobacteria bacterium]|nr:hypothetical protein [Betaproteobacteria bacterium]